MVRRTFPFRKLAWAVGSGRPQRSTPFFAGLAWKNWFETGIQAKIPLLFLMWGVLFIQGCAEPYATSARHYREAPVCCASKSELPIDSLRPGDSSTYTMGADSPLYRFESGRSYFRAFALPEGPYPYRVTVSSYLVGDYLTSAYIFYPRMVTFDEKWQEVRTTGPGSFRVVPAGLLESMKSAGNFRQKIEGGLTFTELNREERYLLVMTTDDLLREKTPFPWEEVPMLVLGSSGGAPAKARAIVVPHAPSGLIGVSCAHLASEPPAAGAAKPAPGSEKAVAVTGDRSAAAPQPGTGRTEEASAPVRPEEVAVRLASGKTIGRLEMGRTNIAAARRLFEVHAAGMGPARDSQATFTVGATRLAPKQLYVPPGTFHQLYFDNDGILVLFVDAGSSESFPTAGDFRLRFPGSRESGRLMGSYELQADLTSCVTIVAVFRTMNDVLASTAYGYICPTKQKQEMP